jgi:hypothetical protein
VDDALAAADDEVVDERTPDGPGRQSRSSTSGTYRWSDFTYAERTTSRYISATPVFQYRAARRRNPPYPNVSATSAAEKSRSAYPSRANARTAFGPSHSDPSMRGVKCTPRKGNAGSGTG